MSKTKLVLLAIFCLTTQLIGIPVAYVQNCCKSVAAEILPKNKKGKQP